MRMKEKTWPRMAFAFLVCACLGTGLAIVSEAWAWSESTAYFVGLGVAMLACLVLTPLVLLPTEILRHPRKAYLDGVAARAQRQRRS